MWTHSPAYSPNIHQHMLSTTDSMRMKAMMSHNPRSQSSLFFSFSLVYSTCSHPMGCTDTGWTHTFSSARNMSMPCTMSGVVESVKHDGGCSPEHWPLTLWDNSLMACNCTQELSCWPSLASPLLPSSPSHSHSLQRVGFIAMPVTCNFSQPVIEAFVIKDAHCQSV